VSRSMRSPDYPLPPKDPSDPLRIIMFPRPPHHP
jgi:hypothetical protein